MTIWNRREWLIKTGMGAAALALAPRWPGAALLAEEPHVTISPLNKLSDEDEIQLGKRFAESLEKEEQIVSNPVIDRYLGGLVSRLAAKSQRPNLPYSVKLVNTRVANACSLPGGFLYLNRGLVELIENEDELVATLAHEIGHVVGRHVVNSLMLSFTARQLLKPVLDNLYKQNGVIADIILKFGGAVAMLAQLKFSRRDESEADLLGFYEMLRAGWDPHGFLDLFARIEELEKRSGGPPIAILVDHPPTAEREEAIRHELTLVSVPKNATRNSLTFDVFKSSMALLPEPPKPPEQAQQ